MGLDMYLARIERNKEQLEAEEVGYWRKANHIHNWFVENIQNDIENRTFYEVSKEKLLELRDLCQKVLDIAVIKDGYVLSYETGGDIDDVRKKEKGNDVKIILTEYGWIQVRVPGKVIENDDEVAELLPTLSGFFFGDCDYNEYYLKNVKETVEIINDVLNTTNFETHMIAYGASW